jgi:protein phosphatase
LTALKLIRDVPVTLKIKAVGRTDKGLVRPGNEDYLHLDQEHGVYAVCDGMGGHQAGEVASMLASEIMRSVFADFGKELTQAQELDLDRILPTSTALLLKAIRLANRAIYIEAAQDDEKAGMGTTVVATAFESDIMSIAHVGDSRAYRLNSSELEPLTRDHSWVEELQESQNVTREEASSFIGKNVITRALGVREDVETDYRIIKIKPGDTFLLCSDGLCGFADDDEIFEVAKRSRDDIKQMTENLVRMANDRGGSDNVTVLAIQVIDIKESPLPETGVATLPAESDEQLKAEDVWVEKIRRFQKENPSRQTAGTPKSEGRKSFFIGILLMFVVVAFLIVCFFQLR